MTRPVELWVEGPTDAIQEPVSSHPAAGAIPPLLSKALHQVLGRSPDVEIRSVWLREKMRSVTGLPGPRRHKLRGWPRKAMIALQVKREREPETIVVAIRDHDGDDTRLSERDQVQNCLRSDGELGQVVAVCVQAVEAWLLADAGAFTRCFGRGPEVGLPGSPETEPDPKAVLRAVIESLPSQPSSWSEVYGSIARKVDLGILRKACPRGYGRFFEDVREFIAPCFADQ